MTEVSPDGTVSELLSERPIVTYDDVSEFHDSACKSFGIRAFFSRDKGITDKDLIREITFRYDEKSNSYQETTKDLPVKRP
ncbi:MAG: hypothetical protein U0271_28965 [Polyangiaceae bacterium]